MNPPASWARGGREQQKRQQAIDIQSYFSLCLFLSLSTVHALARPQLKVMSSRSNTSVEFFGTLWHPHPAPTESQLSSLTLTSTMQQTYSPGKPRSP